MVMLFSISLNWYAVTLVRKFWVPPNRVCFIHLIETTDVKQLLKSCFDFLSCHPDTFLIMA